MMLWSCPRCGRSFKQANQRHACGTTDGGDVVRNRPEAVVRTFAAVDAFVKSLGEVEVVARERYVLFRSVRVFADVSIMTSAVRVAIHLQRRVSAPFFFKVVEDRKMVTHVAKLESEGDVEAVAPFLKEAYETSLR